MVKVGGGHENIYGTRSVTICIWLFILTPLWYESHAKEVG